MGLPITSWQTGASGPEAYTASPELIRTIDVRSFWSAPSIGVLPCFDRLTERVYSDIFEFV